MLKLNLNPKYRLCLGFRLQLASLHPPSIDHRSLKQNYKVILNEYVYCLQNNYTKRLVHAELGSVLCYSRLFIFCNILYNDIITVK